MDVVFTVVDTLRADHLSCYGYHNLAIEDAGRDILQYVKNWPKYIVTGGAKL